MKARFLLTGCLLVNSLLLQANERWFEIEMIIFERTPDAQLQEQFPEQVTPIRLGRHIDLVTPQIAPTILPLLLSLDNCQPDAVSAALSSPFTESWQAPAQLLCQQETPPLSWQRQSLFPALLLNAQTPWPSRIAPGLSGSGDFQGIPYLAEAAALSLTEVADRLRRQRQQHILLHTVWRQAPVTERRAIPSRWFAGENFSPRFDYWGQPKLATAPTAAPLADSNNTGQTESMADLLEQIESRRQQLAAGVTLDQPNTAASDSSISQNQANLPSEVWQLDGLFKLHLDHYLFVNTDFNLRHLAGDTLQSINIKQSRRVISGEIHYLDHPKLGIVLQIRRFSPTAEPISDITE